MLITLIIVYISAVPLQAAWRRVCNVTRGQEDFRLDYDWQHSSLNVTLKNKSTQVTSYDIQLLANSSVADLERIDCNEPTPLSPHSTVKLTAENAFSARLPHMYTGFYRMLIVPWFRGGSNPSIAIEFVVETPVIPVAVQNWSTRFIIHPLPRLSTIIVQFEPAAAEFEFQNYELTLFATESDSCDYIDGKHFFICYANQTSPECSFERLFSGSYCAQIRPLDQRCAFGFVWKVLDNCVVHSDIIQLDNVDPGLESVESIFNDRANQTNSAAVLAGIVVTLSIIVSLVVATILWICRRGSEAPKNFIPLQPSVSNSFQQKRIEGSRTVLLLRMTDEEQQLHQSIQQLKQQLQDHCNAEILDVYEEPLRETVTIDPVGWMNRITAIKDLRVIVVDTPRLRHQLDCVPSEGLSHMEQLVLYLIKQMWTSQVTGQRETLYNSTFLVRFSNTTLPNVHVPLTPFRCFNFPLHRLDLFFYVTLNEKAT